MKRILSILIIISIAISYCTLPVAAATTIEEEVEEEEEPVRSPEREIVVVEEIVVIVEEQKKEKAEPVEEKPKERIVEEEKTIEIKHVPDVRDFKSYTNYKMISRSSAQWQKIQTIAYSDENGLRKVDNYYCAAMGSYYTHTLGDLFKIGTAEGNEFIVIICDFKSDAHTNSTHQYTASNGCIIEFYVDYSCFNQKAKRAGSVSAISGFGGKITSIEYIGNYFEANS